MKEIIKPEIEFTAKAVGPLSLFMAKIDIRYYLNGLCVMPSPDGVGCIIVGCDGHRMALWHDKEGKCSKQTIFKVSPALIAACKKRGKMSMSRTVKYIGGRLVLIEGIEGELYIQPGNPEIKGKYPDVFKVVPDPEKLVPGLRGNIQPGYMKNIGEAGKMLSDAYSAVSFYTGDEAGHCANVAVFDSQDNFMIVTMPIRGRSGFPVIKPINSVFIVPKAEEQKAA